MFNLARRFAEKWDIPDEAVNSHIQLACGYFKFPVILLLNPAPTHEFLPFNEMVDECNTLRWIEDTLHGIGLGLGDVIILDACTLLGSDRLRQLGRKGRRMKQQAMAEAYDVTQEMLRLIEPSIILSCQCSTSFPDWNAGGHLIARQLCSSIRAARNREVKEVYLDDNCVNVIQAYHPSGFLNRNTHHDTFGYLLEAVFRTVYFPCGNWKSQHLMATLASSKRRGRSRVSRKLPKLSELILILFLRRTIIDSGLVPPSYFWRKESLGGIEQEVGPFFGLCCVPSLYDYAGSDFQFPYDVYIPGEFVLGCDFELACSSDFSLSFPVSIFRLWYWFHCLIGSYSRYPNCLHHTDQHEPH